MSDNTVAKVGSDSEQIDESANHEGEPKLSKSQKKKAKKQQKKNSESNHVESENEAQPSIDKPLTIDVSSGHPSTETSENTKEDEKEAAKKKQQVVPIIQRFDVDGKQIKTIAGNMGVFLGEITPHNILQLKKLNEAVFPIAYNDKFYVEARVCGDLGRLAYYNDVVVGAVCCRIDDISDEKALYLMTLGTLAAYRQCGIGTVLINYALRLCKKMEEIKTMYLHVQVNNQNAVHFYEKHGFTNDGIIEDYYRISPRDAYLLIKRIR
ncbi:unnamed protein product [Caenorhabditis brenneri]